LFQTFTVDVIALGYTEAEGPNLLLSLENNYSKQIWRLSGISYEGGEGLGEQAAGFDNMAQARLVMEQTLGQPTKVPLPNLQY
jgi:hypothetical protein